MCVCECQEPSDPVDLLRGNTFLESAATAGHSNAPTNHKLLSNLVEMLCMTLHAKLGWLVLLWPLHKLATKVRCTQALLNFFLNSTTERYWCKMHHMAVSKHLCEDASTRSFCHGKLLPHRILCFCSLMRFGPDCQCKQSWLSCHLYAFKQHGMCSSTSSEGPVTCCDSCHGVCRVKPHQHPAELHIYSVILLQAARTFLGCSYLHISSRWLMAWSDVVRC